MTSRTPTPWVLLTWLCSLRPTPALDPMSCPGLTPGDPVVTVLPGEEPLRNGCARCPRLCDRTDGRGRFIPVCGHPDVSGHSLRLADGAHSAASLARCNFSVAGRALRPPPCPADPCQPFPISDSSSPEKIASYSGDVSSGIYHRPSRRCARSAVPWCFRFAHLLTSCRERPGFIYLPNTFAFSCFVPPDRVLIFLLTTRSVFFAVSLIVVRVRCGSDPASFLVRGSVFAFAGLPTPV